MSEQQTTPFSIKAQAQARARAECQHSSFKGILKEHRRIKTARAQFTDRLPHAFALALINDQLVDEVGIFKYPRHPGFHQQRRSEERRVGKECRSRWSPDH